MSNLHSFTSGVPRRAFLRGTLGLGAAAVATKALAACGAPDDNRGGNGSSGEVVEFRYNLGGPVAVFWPMYVANSLGFAAEVDINQQLAVDATNGVQQLLSGDINAWGHSTDVLSVAANRGGPLVGVAGLPPAGWDMVVTDDVEDIRDLRGAKIGVALLQGSAAAIVRGLMRAEGIEDDEYELIQTGAAAQKIAALQSGVISGTLFMAPQSSDIVARQEGFRLLLNTRDAFTAPMITSWMNSGWAEENRELVVSWLAAHLRASAWLADEANRDKAVEILAEATEVDEEACASTYDQYQEAGLFDDPLSVDFAGLDNFLDLVADTGVGPFEPAESYFDMSYLDEARELAG